MIYKIIRFTKVFQIKTETGTAVVQFSPSHRQPRLKEIIIDRVSKISYTVIMIVSSNVVALQTRHGNWGSMKESDFINNEFIPCHLQDVPESYGTGITQLSAEYSGPIPDSVKGIAKHILNILDRIKNSLGIKNGKEGNRG